MAVERANVLVLTYWSFKDALIQTYTLPYVRMIRKNIHPRGKVILITLEHPLQKCTKEEKLFIRRGLENDGIEWKSFSYTSFGFFAGVKFIGMIVQLWWMVGQQNINTIHAWCTTAGGLGWILSRMTGKTLILDSYEPHAEPMIEAGEWDKESLAFRILFWLEKKQSRHANIAISCVDKMKEYALEKYNASFNSFYTKPAGVDFDLFHQGKRKNPDLIKKYGLEDKFVYAYAGKFGGSYLTDEVFELFRVAQDFYGDRFAVILLNNHSEEFISNLVQKHGLNRTLIIHEFVPHSQVPEYMGLGDVGLVPFVPVPSKRFGSPIKTAEYLALGIPIIITKDISDDSDFVIKNNVGFVLNDFNYEGYNRIVKAIDEMIRSDANLSDRCRQSAMQYRSFDQAEKIYKELYAAH